MLPGVCRPDTSHHTVSAEVIERLAVAKFSLLAHGVRLDDSCAPALERAKGPMRTRSGVSGGLDLVLPHNVHVNAPVAESFAITSLFSLRQDDVTGLHITDDQGSTWPVDIAPAPRYYAQMTGDGLEEMKRIGQMCSADRFCYGMTGPGCHFWPTSKRCRYCSIGFNYDADAAKKRKAHLLEVLGAAISDEYLPARHVLLGGGTPPGDDMGAVLAAELTTAIKRAYPAVSVYVMIAAPLKDHFIDMLFDSGADELGMNLEFWSDAAWQEYIPGKRAEIGKSRYLEALEYAVRRFGPINTRSIFIAGLEDSRFTIEGVAAVAALGVMPIVSPFRALAGTMLENAHGFSGSQYAELWHELEVALESTGMPLGPTCIACQNNTLALPFGNQYRSY